MIVTELHGIKSGITVCIKITNDKDKYIGTIGNNMNYVIIAEDMNKAMERLIAILDEKVKDFNLETDKSDVSKHI